jgi:hypothetical protein
MLLLACKSLFDMNLTISYRFDFRVLLLSWFRLIRLSAVNRLLSRC